MELFLTSVWLIWTQRNQARLKKPSISTHLIASSANERVVEFALNQPVPAPPWLATTSTRNGWRPPTQGVVTINCDGATFKKQKKSGIGVVI